MTFTRFTLATATAALVASSAWANTEAADANGDGMLTLEEVQAVHSDIDADAFAEMDTNADGMLDADEIAAARDEGLMPAQEG